MIWVQYDLLTGDILATNSAPVETLPEGRGQAEAPDGFRPEGNRVDPLTGVPGPVGA